MKLGNQVNRFQAGGPMPAGAPAQAPQGGEDPTAALRQAAQQAIQGQDCQIAMQVCQMLIEALGGATQGAAAPQESAPAEPQDQPVYRRGGKLLRRIPRD